MLFQPNAVYCNCPVKDNVSECDSITDEIVKGKLAGTARSRGVDRASTWFTKLRPVNDLEFLGSDSFLTKRSETRS